LPLLPRDEPHVVADLKRIEKGKPLLPVLLVRGEMASGLPLVITGSARSAISTKAPPFPAGS
jgi:hypothetical protein